MAYVSETQQLKQSLNRLVSKAQENQAVLDRFQKFELAMLGANSIGELLDTLLIKSIRHFELSDCRIIWFDSELPMRSLITEDVRSQFGHRLVFSGMYDDVHSLFNNHHSPILRALTPVEKLRWFPGRTHVLSAAFMPLMCQGKIQGAVLFGSPDVKRFSADKATDFIAHMGLILSVCMQNSINREQIRLLSMLDNLTKVKNRRCFDQDIRTEISRAQRSHQPLSCLFVDADFFKKVNDTYGHPGGDETLICMSRWIQEQMREGDHLARLGGEEFAVLLPQCNDELAFHVAERIRAHVAQQDIHFEEHTFNITLSVGVSTFYPDEFPHMGLEDIAKKLVAHADLGVYDSKSAGRNQVSVRVFTEQVESMALA